MQPSIMVFAFLLSILPTIQAAQEPNPKSTLTEAEREGRRVYQRKCAVCHVPAAAHAMRYAPELFKTLVAGREDFIYKIIMDGKGDRMPGWKHTLQPKQIHAVIDYLKTLDQPTRTVASERDEL